MIVRKYGAGIILTMMTMFLLSAFLLLSFRHGSFDEGIFLPGLIFAAFIVVKYNVLSAIFKHIDRFVMLIADFLCVVGMVMLYRLDPEIGEKQFIWILMGNACMIVALLVISKVKDFGKANWVFMFIGIGMLALTFLLAQTTYGARNWISIGGFSFQPSEFVKVLFLIVTAYFFSVKQRKRDMWPYFIFTMLCVGFLVLSTDLGAAILFAGTFLIVFYVATASLGITMLCAGGFVGGALLSYQLFSHVRVRVSVWQDPWANYHENGYQIVQGLLAIASGGLLGTGLGNGMPQSIPVAESDYIFAAISEEFGIIVSIALIVMYLVFIIRGILIAMDARTTFNKLLVFAATCMLSLQSFIIIGGVIKLIPLTGITMPFVSYGGSSMMSSLMILGIIQGVAVKNGETDEAELTEMGGGIE